VSVDGVCLRTFFNEVSGYYIVVNLFHDADRVTYLGQINWKTSYFINKTHKTTLHVYVEIIKIRNRKDVLKVAF
jgi:hypothetical protein